MRVGLTTALSFVGAMLALPPAAIAQVQINQNFIPQGPAPSFGQVRIIGSADAANGTKGTATGAVQAILLDPRFGPDTMFVGATSGGIWKTTDGGSTWKALTDDQSILSIGSLGIDATDPKKLFAGIGNTSSGQSWGPLSTSGASSQQPLIYSADGGDKWTPLAGSSAFANQTVVGVAATQNPHTPTSDSTILAATFELSEPTQISVEVGTPLYGLYRSINGGESFKLVDTGMGLPSGPVTALVADKSDPTKATYYAAVTSPNDKTSQGVYRTQDFGETWEKFFTSETPTSDGPNFLKQLPDNQVVFRLATGRNGEVAIAIASNLPVPVGKPTLEDGNAQLGGLYLATKSGGSYDYTALQVPSDNNANNGAIYKLGLLIDPNSPQGAPIVYVSGDIGPDSQAPTYPSPVFRVPADCKYNILDSCVTVLICELENGECVPGSGPTGAAHADSRQLTVDAAGNLLLVGDGGVYKLTDPQKDNGVWSGLNSTLQVHESYQIGYGGYAKRLVTAAQDTGVAIQSAPDSPLYEAVQGFDGYHALARDVNDKSFADEPVSVYYTGSMDLNGMGRLVLDGDGNVVSPQSSHDGTITVAGVPVTCTLQGEASTECGTATATTWNTSVLNRKDQSRLAFIGLDPQNKELSVVYVAQDTAPASAFSVNLDLNSVGSLTDALYQMVAYGAPNNTNALLAGAGNSSLYLSTTAEASSLVQLEQYTGENPSSLVFGMSDQNFYVADTVNLWGTLDGGNQFIASTLPTSLTNPNSVEFINNNGVNALLVGGLMSCPSGTCSDSQSPIAVADSNQDGSLDNWRLFGSNLPNALVYDMSYNPWADVLAIAGVGRGLWTLYDVTSYFKQADVLQFGLADNDSIPDEIYLKDGQGLDGTSFVRPLNKYGTGKLTIAGSASYTGGTSIFDGTLQLGAGGESGSILGDVSFCSDTIEPLNGLATCNPGIDKFLVFDRSNTYSFDGAISGPGQLVKNGPGTTILTATNTYTGPTWVNQGALIVNGSILSSVTVNAEGLLGGTGSVGATTVGYGGILAPGNSIGTMTVNGNLTLSSGSVYEVEANAQGKSDKVIVKGTVNLTGATLKILTAPGAYKPKTDYVIIDNDGTDAVKGTFANVMNNLAFLAPSVIYDGGTGNDVVLTLINTTFDFCSVTKTRNQCNVANAVSQFPIDDPLYLAVISQTEQGARQAFDALSGEIHATVAGTLANDSRYVREAMLGRMMQATYSDGGSELASLAAAGPQVASLDGGAMMLGGSSPLYDGKSLIEAEPVPVAFWTRAFGAWGDLDTDGNAASADRDIGGFISGIDANIGGSWRVGLATGASFSNVEAEARYSSADIETYHLGGYVVGMAGAFALRGGGSWAWNDIDTSRAVLFPGFYERQTASYDADTGQLFGEVAYPTQMGGISVEPFAGLAYVSIDSESFGERGGALASLRGTADQDVGYSTVGLRAARTMHWGEMIVTPHISAAWQHAFDDVTPGAALAFATTGIGFTVAGVPLAEDAVLLDTGLHFAISDTMTAGVSYAGQFGDGVTDNAVKGQLTWLF